MEPSEYKKMDEMEKDHWWFVAKRNILKLTIEKELGSLKGKKVLDVGCGTGAVMQMVTEMGAEVDGVDMSELALSYCSDKGLKVMKGEADKIPFADDTFDLVLALDVLEHIEKDSDAVKEIKRVLKPGGVFVVTVPAHQWLFSNHDRSLHHFRRYSKKELIELFKNSFNDVKISWIHGLIFIPAIVQRNILKFIKLNNKGSIKSGFVNRIFGVWYRLEMFILNKFNTLPIGLSLIGIVKK